MHRDIKPDNVLLEELGNPVLCDFSLAKVVDPSKACATSAPMADGEGGAGAGAGGKKKAGVGKGKKKGGASAAANPLEMHTAEMGTPTYIAPEVVNGRTDYGTAVDVWSMGYVHPRAHLVPLSLQVSPMMH